MLDVGKARSRKARSRKAGSREARSRGAGSSRVKRSKWVGETDSPKSPSMSIIVAEKDN